MSAVQISADQINAEYRAAQSSIVDSVNHYLKCGRLLLEKKSRLKHGTWKNWVEENCEFKARAAQRMMKAYEKASSTTHLDEDTAIAISRDIWGNSTRSGSRDIGAADRSTEVQILEKPDDHFRQTRQEPTQDESDWLRIRQAAELLDGMGYPGVPLARRFGKELLQEQVWRMLERCSAAFSDINSARKSLASIPLSDGSRFEVSTEFVENLALKFPKVDVARALSDCSAWHGLHPEKRKTEAEIKREILHGMTTIAGGGRVWR